MPTFMSQGESKETPIKQLHLSGFLDMQLQMCRGALRNPDNRWLHRDHIQYFDLYSGCGESSNGAAGSPILFLEAIERIDIPYRAVFIDKNPQATEYLRDLIPKHHQPFCTVLCDDNKMAMRPFLRVTKQPRLGLVYADPNGVVAWDLLTWMSQMKRYERTDILVYLSANRGLKLHRRSYPEQHKYLTEYMDDINKRYWLVREPHTNFEWTFIYGTNWADFPEWRRAGFHRVDSPKGVSILHRLNFTRKERDTYVQPSLLDI